MDHLTTVTLSTALPTVGVICTVLLAFALRLDGAIKGQIAMIAAAAVALAWLSAAPLNRTVLERLLTHRVPGERTPFAQTLENRSGIITVERDGVVYGNGMYDGRFNTDLVHDSNLIVRPYALSLYHAAPRHVLMIGLSSGSWAQVLAGNPEVEHLTAVEINPGYLQLAATHPEVASLLANRKVELITDDRRRWLRSHPQAQFDAILMNATWHFRMNASALLSLEFLGMLRQHLLPGGTVFYNTTESARVQHTGCLAIPYGMRISNHMLLSTAPITLDFARWQDVLLRTRTNGSSALDLRRAEDRHALQSLMAIQSGGSDYGPDFLESCDSIEARAGALPPITDDNMGTEWRYPLGLDR